MVSILHSCSLYTCSFFRSYATCLSSVGRAGKFSSAGHGFDTRSGGPLSTGWVGVSKM